MKQSASLFQDGSTSANPLAGDIARLLQQRRANAGSVTLSA